MGGDNVFAYAPNPTGWVDPLGLDGGPYGLGGGPYSQYNTIKRNTANFNIYKSITAWHFEGRVAKNGIHPTYKEVTAKGSGWRLLPKSQSIFHDDGVGKPELKFVHPDGREAVFNGDCLCPETRPQYMPTYNYVNPGKVLDKKNDIPGLIEYGSRQLGHGVVDVVPYFIGGNVRGAN